MRPYQCGPTRRPYQCGPTNAALPCDPTRRSLPMRPYHFVGHPVGRSPRDRRCRPRGRASSPSGPPWFASGSQCAVHGGRLGEAALPCGPTMRPYHAALPGGPYHFAGHPVGRSPRDRRCRPVVGPARRAGRNGSPVARHARSMAAASARRPYQAVPTNASLPISLHARLADAPPPILAANRD
jgi:hypothetical protein